MLKTPTIQLKHKIPLIIVGFSLMVGAILQVAVYQAYKERTIAAIEEEFNTVASLRHELVQTWLESLTTQIRLQASAPGTIDAIVELGSAYRGLREEATTVLQDAYITNNPKPVGERQNLRRAAGDTPYNIAHGEYHPFFHDMQQQLGLYDIFLFDHQGSLVYSVFKEDDFAQNFVTGPYAESGLGEAWKISGSLAKGEVRMVDIAPYAPSNNAPASFIISPVVSPDGRVMGALAFQLPLEALQAQLSGVSGLGETGEAFIVGSDMTMRSNSRFEGGFNVLDAVEPSAHISALLNGTEGFFTDTTLQNGAQGFAQVRKLEKAGVSWGLVVERDSAEIMAPLQSFLIRILTILAVVSVVVLGLGFLIARSITKPILGLSGAVQSIAAGKLSQSVDQAARQDELGQIGQSLESLREKLLQAEALKAEREAREAEQRRVVTALSDSLQNLAAGDLTQNLSEPFAADYETLRDNFNNTLQTLSETITKVIETSESIRARSTEISRSSEDLSRRTENQAAALEETAAALDELTSSVRSAADGTKKVEDIVSQARREAEDSGAIVQGAVSAMTEIEKSSDQISQIIGVIDDIAFQTSLLALNAGVEAARAGDAGKGFAVVASEVRALAQRSSAAAKEIKTLISTSTQHVGRGVEQVGQAGDALRRIVERVAHIANLVSEIASGAVEQSTGLAEINIGVTQLDQVTQQNAAMVEETTAASQSLHHDANSLAEMVAGFSTQKGNARSSSVVVDLGAKSRQATFKAQPRASSALVASGTDRKGVWQDF